jgi:hypothetical protein
MSSDASELPTALTTSLNEEVYGAFYASYEQGDYEAILGAGVVDLLAEDPQRDQILQDLALAVLTEFHQGIGA